MVKEWSFYPKSMWLLNNNPQGLQWGRVVEEFENFLKGLSGHTYKIEMERAQMIFGSNFSMHLFDDLELEPKKEAEGPPNFCLAEKLVEMNKLMLW